MDITRYQPVIAETLKKLRVPKNQRDDMTQECYVALLKRQEELPGEDPALASQICWRAVQDVRKSAREEVKTGAETKGRLMSTSDPRTRYKAESVPDPFTVEDLEDVIDLDKALSTLSAEEYLIVHGIFFQGWTLNKAVELTGLTKDQVRWRKQQGIQKLREYFKEA